MTQAQSNGTDPKYRFEHPVTGAVTTFQRTTELTKSISDTSALDAWKKRMIATGFVRRPDLLEVFATETRRAPADALVEAAYEAGGGNDASERGTALHAVTEAVDRGLLRLTDVPDHQQDDVRAYVTTMARARVEILPQYIECVVVNVAVNVAGTFDRIVRLWDGRVVIADLKTGQRLDYGWPDIAMQLAVYANAPVIRDTENNEYVQMPAVDKNVALVMHAPAGKGICNLWLVDIASAWESAQAAAAVRDWRRRNGMARMVDLGDLLLHDITGAPDVAAIERLWSCNQDLWTEQHTATARARAALLVAN